MDFRQKCHILGDFTYPRSDDVKEARTHEKDQRMLRLAYLNALSERQIAVGANVKKTTVHDYLLRAKRTSLVGPKSRG